MIPLLAVGWLSSLLYRFKSPTTTSNLHPAILAVFFLYIYLHTGATPTLALLLPLKAKYCRDHLGTPHAGSVS